MEICSKDVHFLFNYNTSRTSMYISPQYFKWKKVKGKRNRYIRQKQHLKKREEKQKKNRKKNINRQSYITYAPRIKQKQTFKEIFFFN